MSKAIVINEHQQRGLTDFCRWCGLTYLEQQTNRCSNRLAVVPEGWEGETVEVDDATAEFLKATP